MHMKKHTQAADFRASMPVTLTHFQNNLDKCPFQSHPCWDYHYHQAESKAKMNDWRKNENCWVHTRWTSRHNPAKALNNETKADWPAWVSAGWCCPRALDVRSRPAPMCKALRWMWWQHCASCHMLCHAHAWTWAPQSSWESRSSCNVGTNVQCTVESPLVQSGWNSNRLWTASLKLHTGGSLYWQVYFMLNWTLLQLSPLKT